MVYHLLFFMVTKMPGLGNFTLTPGFRGLMTVIMAVRKWRNWCVHWMHILELFIYK